MPNQKQYKKKNNKSNYSRKGKETSRPQDPGVDTVKDPMNDYRWYMITENIGSAGASIPFNVFAGVKEFLDWKHAGGNVPNNTYNSTPGVMVIDYIPTFGSADDNAAAINVAARAIYAFNRKANSGAKNYESPDFMMYNLAMDNLVSLILDAKRIYRIAMTYSAENRYLPDALLTGMNVIPNAIRDNLAQFRYGINLRIAKLSALYFPKAFKLYERHALLNSIVLMDSTSIRSQFYLPFATHYYVWSPRTDKKGTELVLKEKKQNRTIIEIFDEIDECLNILLRDEDAGMMSGDIQKAWGESNCYTMTELNENETQLFTYDMDLLNQIQNSITAPGIIKDLSFWNVKQDGGSLATQYPISNSTQAFETMSESTWAAKLLPLYNKTYFNSHKDVPDWKDTLEWSRLICASSELAANNTIYLRPSSEMVVGFRILLNNYLTNLSYGSLSELKFSTVIVVGSDQFGGITPEKAVTLLTELSKFDWHPIVYCVGASNAPDLNAETGLLGAMYDSKVHTIVDRDTKVRLNDLASMGLFMGTNL